MHVFARWVVLVLACWICLPARAGEITVYTALENDEVTTYLAAARKALPDVRIKVMRLSTGDLAARVLAESAHPHNDVIWGEALTEMLDPRILGLLQPATLAQVQALPGRYRSAGNVWFAPTGYATALCVNTQALASAHLPVPRTLQDLTLPAYKGQVVMPNPRSSGAGYMVVAGVLAQAGQDKGWAKLKALAANVAQYTDTGSRPCKMVRTGEYAIGISFDLVALQAIKQGFPIRMVIPADSAGYELEASGLMKGAANPADAKRFLDWTASPQAAVLYRQYKSIVAAMPQPTAEQVRMGLPADFMQRLPAIDFRAEARQRAGVVQRWQQEIQR